MASTPEAGGAESGPFRLFYHPASSASMRVTLYLRCGRVPDSLVERVSTGLATDHRGILVFTMPEGDPETEKNTADCPSSEATTTRVAVLITFQPGGTGKRNSGHRRYSRLATAQPLSIARRRQIWS